MTIDFAEILLARQRISASVLRTPQREARALSARLGVPVQLKCEHHQTTGSFKLRGATNAVLSLTRAQRDAGVVAASTGNHGRALAHAAAAAGTKAVICMSRLVPDNKVQAIEALGAEIRIVGNSQDDAQVEVDRLASEAGMTPVPPFDHAAVIAGQGTLGLEMLEDAPHTTTVLVPLSGGGLLAGVALALRTLKPAIRIIGVTMENGAAMQASLAAGAPVMVEEVPTLADSLGGGIGLANQYTFSMVRDLVDEVVLVSEVEIAQAMRAAYFEEGEVLEGAAAVGIAALDAGKVTLAGPAVVLLSGKNIDMKLHRRIMAGENPDLAAEARHD
ncbi:hydroxyectoine utilization dehydratase EutB [Devosia ginsengisoli]|uniref:Hydroxyectoine utilization dehydratase EutB n=1 Tax=Devosia ginsengisoli TaxID=400770 RepID=A0A5B8LVV5_9HYPH|nr:hydroxyectoine utilization dehydratase EutB [Devosia ginsengisoli]QDZ12498.1 hydroxyectoine utilization dehydratase EutB [Devosia ginsengisoli]